MNVRDDVRSRDFDDQGLDVRISDPFDRSILYLLVPDLQWVGSNRIKDRQKAGLESVPEHGRTGLLVIEIREVKVGFRIVSQACKQAEQRVAMPPAGSDALRTRSPDFTQSVSPAFPLFSFVHSCRWFKSCSSPDWYADHGDAKCVHTLPLTQMHLHACYLQKPFV